MFDPPPPPPRTVTPDHRASPEAAPICRRVCPVCAGELHDIRHKLICSRCHTIVETCCEGGRG